MSITTSFLERIENHYENMMISNQRIFAQFRTELRRADLHDNHSEKDKYLSTCMETIN